MAQMWLFLLMIGPVVIIGVSMGAGARNIRLGRFRSMQAETDGDEGRKADIPPSL